jgi:hypothetical protein
MLSQNRKEECIPRKQEAIHKWRIFHVNATKKEEKKQTENKKEAYLSST